MPTFPITNLDDVRIGVIGLGYVGLPLAVELANRYATIGFDIKAERIAELQEGRDSTREVEAETLRGCEGLRFTHEPSDLEPCNCYIVTVPTPIDASKRPDLRPLQAASHTVGQVLSAGDVVIYESTVYPGATEEVCVPILEAESGLSYLKHDPDDPTSGPGVTDQPWEARDGFYVGYSPERINPGDKGHRLADIVKVTSASTPEAADFVDRLYASIITAGTHRAPTIRTAEAAKVIENTQRDVNIALVNELAILFNRMGLDTQAVLEAAGTKWNFLPFRPGLVGGHCIGVDPYYLTHKAQAIDHHPEMILAGRRINDGMGRYIASEVLKLMTRKRIQVVDARILVLGLTFKENCPDIRNTQVAQLVHELAGYHARVEVCDPWADPDEAASVLDIRPTTAPEGAAYDAVILAVAHDAFRELDAERLQALCADPCVVYDIKRLLPSNLVDGHL